jgi:hypothetical protein
MIILLLLLSTGGSAGHAATETPEFTLIGDAVMRGSILRLAPDEYSESGAAWLVEKQAVVDGFTASFDFRISRNAAIGGDGFAFVIQNTNGIALGHHGLGIGYSGIANSVALEFDTYKNVDFGFEGLMDDPNENHLSVQSRGVWAHNSADPQYSLGHTTGVPLLADGHWHTVEIVYTPGTLTVSLDGTQVLTVGISLEEWVILDADGTAWVGFTAATGDWVQVHDVRRISFTASS